jgi:hypothetical protein
MLKPRRLTGRIVEIERTIDHSPWRAKILGTFKRHGYLYYLVETEDGKLQMEIPVDCVVAIYYLKKKVKNNRKNNVLKMPIRNQGAKT